MIEYDLHNLILSRRPPSPEPSGPKQYLPFRAATSVIQLRLLFALAGRFTSAIRVHQTYAPSEGGTAMVIV
jgi:hypothetical protein